MLAEMAVQAEAILFIYLLFYLLCRMEGRTWYTSHRGRLWIAAAAKRPTPQEIAQVEATYQQICRKGVLWHWSDLVRLRVKRCTLCVNPLTRFPAARHDEVIPVGSI